VTKKGLVLALASAVAISLGVCVYYCSTYYKAVRLLQHLLQSCSLTPALITKLFAYSSTYYKAVRLLQYLLQSCSPGGMGCLLLR